MKYSIVILVLIFVLGQAVFSQEPTPIDDLKRGAKILAKQYHYQNEPHKAKTLAKLYYDLEPNKEESKELINMINNKEKIELEAKLEDNGIAYALFLYNQVRSLPDSPENREIKNRSYFICSVIDEKNSGFKLYPSNRGYEKYYHDLFPPDSSHKSHDNFPNGNKKKIEEFVLENIDYNPTNLIEVINNVNYQIRESGKQIYIQSSRIRVEDVSDSNGYRIMYGRHNDAIEKLVKMEKITMAEFLRFIDQTTWLTYTIEEHKIKIFDKTGKENNRPQFLKLTSSLLKDVQNSLIRSKSIYDNKFMQIKGKITNIKDADANVIIEIDGAFLITINKANLKPESLKLIVEKLSSPERNSHSLEVVVQGTCQIKKLNLINIENCTSILAENLGFFYTK